MARVRTERHGFSPINVVIHGDLVFFSSGVESILPSVPVWALPPRPVGREGEEVLDGGCSKWKGRWLWEESRRDQEGAREALGGG